MCGDAAADFGDTESKSAHRSISERKLSSDSEASVLSGGNMYTHLSSESEVEGD